MFIKVLKLIRHVSIIFRNNIIIIVLKIIFYRIYEIFTYKYSNPYHNMYSFSINI
jgi:hypothetical protein